MSSLDQTARGQALPTGAELLSLERRARSAGSGLSAEALAGVWRLERLWSRQGEPAALAAGLLRGLAARLEIEAAEGGLRLCNAVILPGLELRFLGEGCLRGRRPLLVFCFSCLELRLAGRVLLRRQLPQPDPRRQPFFALIARGGAAAGGSGAGDGGGAGDGAIWLAARGRGGGLALWLLQTAAASDSAPTHSP